MMRTRDVIISTKTTNKTISEPMKAWKYMQSLLEENEDEKLPPVWKNLS